MSFHSGRGFRRYSWQTLLFGAGLIGFALGQVPSAFATLVVRDSFDYTTGNLAGKSGGAGSWSGTWMGDTNLQVSSPGLTYTNGGNALTVAGNAVRSNSNDIKQNNRTVTGTHTGNGAALWLSVLIQGATGSNQMNVNLSEKFFIGQGNKTTGGTTWAIASDSGYLHNTSTTASGVTAYLVALLEFAAGNDRVWMWINPALNTTPAKSAAANGLAGTSVPDLTFDKVFLYMSESNGAIDEFRLGTTYGDVAPFTAVPEPSAFLFGGLVCGILGLVGCYRKFVATRRCRVA